jgi:hypothetical protein
MSTLTELQTRLAQRLADTGNVTWSADALAEAIRAALDEYNQSAPLGKETVITLPAAGREIALDGVAGLLDVIEVWWPYDSDAAAETWPPNQPRGFRLWWDDGRPVLLLDDANASQPQAGDELRLWHTAPHTIAGLDDGDATTLPATHEGPLLTGAAGHAVTRQMIRRAGAVRIDPHEAAVLQAWGEARLADFRAWLAGVRESKARGGRAWLPGGWPLDKWDGD